MAILSKGNIKEDEISIYLFSLPFYVSTTSHPPNPKGVRFEIDILP